MKLNILRKKYISFLLLTVPLVITCLVSCSDENENIVTSYTLDDKSSINEEPAEATENENTGTLLFSNRDVSTEVTAHDKGTFTKKNGYSPLLSPPKTFDGYSPSGRVKLNTFDEYTVVLGADKHLYIPGLPGELIVWIGDSIYKPDFPSRMEENETTVQANGKSATVEPFAPAFEIDPSKTQCIKIDPRGSQVRFELKPKKSGTFEVTADVNLYESNDCSGTPTPKGAAALKVKVEVSQKEILTEKVKELSTISWEKILEFWGTLLTLILAVILFLIKGKLKQWFGFEEK